MSSDKKKTKHKKKIYLLLVKEDDIISTMQEPHDSHMMSTHRSGQKEKDSRRMGVGGGDMT